MLKSKKFPDNPPTNVILEVINNHAIRYLEAMIGAYIQVGDPISASRIRKIIHEIKIIRKQAEISTQ